MKVRVERDSLADVSLELVRCPTAEFAVLAELVITASDSHVALSGFDYEVSTRQQRSGCRDRRIGFGVRPLLADIAARCPHNRWSWLPRALAY